MKEEYPRREKVQEVFESLSKYEDMEFISLLELAISCLNGESLKFETMQEIETFDPAEYKRESRIKSGAAAIIFGVLLFLKVLVITLPVFEAVRTSLRGSPN
jgi:hypothetical protein